MPQTSDEFRRWWGASWEEFEDRWTMFDGVADDILCRWFFEAIGEKPGAGDEGIVIGGYPRWQNGRDPRCASLLLPNEAWTCRRQKGLVLQISRLLGPPAIEPPDHPLTWHGKDGVFLFVCRQCGEPSLELLGGVC